MDEIREQIDTLVAEKKVQREQERKQQQEKENTAARMANEAANIKKQLADQYIQSIFPSLHSCALNIVAHVKAFFPTFKFVEKDDMGYGHCEIHLENIDKTFWSMYSSNEYKLEIQFFMNRKIGEIRDVAFDHPSRIGIFISRDFLIVRYKPSSKCMIM